MKCQICYAECRTGNDVFTMNLPIFKSLVARIFFSPNPENVRAHSNRSDNGSIENTKKKPHYKGSKW